MPRGEATEIGVTKGLELNGNWLIAQMGQGQARGSLGKQPQILAGKCGSSFVDGRAWCLELAKINGLERGTGQ